MCILYISHILIPSLTKKVYYVILLTINLKSSIDSNIITREFDFRFDLGRAHTHTVCFAALDLTRDIVFLGFLIVAINFLKDNLYSGLFSHSAIAAVCNKLCVFRKTTHTTVVPITMPPRPPHPAATVGYSYVPCHRALLPSSDTSSSSAQLLSSRTDLSISSHSPLILIILSLLLLRFLSSSCVLHLALSPSHFIDLPKSPDQLFFLPVTVKVSFPET